MNLSFDHEFTITLGDTDALHGVYFTHFFRLQGVVRELWVLNAVANSRGHLRDGIVIVTRSASCDYHRNLRLFDRVICKMQVRQLRLASAELVFRFFHADTGELHAEGRQLVAFMDRTGRLRRMPEDFREAAERYQEPESGCPASQTLMEEYAAA